MKLIDFLDERQVEFELIPHCETHDAQRLAAAIHVSGHRVAKTVLLKADAGYRYVVAVLPADMTVDLRLASEMLGGSKLVLATEHEIAEFCPDCEVGVLPPFGSSYAMKTIVDKSLAEQEEIVFEGNTHHEAVRMKFEDFRRIEQPLIGFCAKR